MLKLIVGLALLPLALYTMAWLALLALLIYALAFG